jgi:alkanesulfonate monooxygenase SsuD/methylene tetrahydromethanopterin reductase-like flavin-dependent oxidoreductase (luciferase family)
MVLMALRIGVQYTPPPGQPIAATVRAAIEIEAMGYACLAVPDHLTRPHASGPVAVPDPFALLARLAADTTTIGLATMTVLDALRMPIQTLRSAATLQQISGGRFELGIGAGWQHTDLQALAPGLRAAEARITSLERTLQLIRQAWSSPEVTGNGAAGPLARTLAAGTSAPRVTVAAGTDRLLHLAARFADEIALTVPTRPRLAGATPTAASVAAQIATTRRARPTSMPPCRFHLQIRRIDPVAPDDPDRDWWTVGGSPGQVAAAFHERAAAGVACLGICTEDLRLLEWLSSKVLPRCEVQP